MPEFEFQPPAQMNSPKCWGTAPQYAKAQLGEGRATPLCVKKTRFATRASVQLRNALQPA